MKLKLLVLFLVFLFLFFPVILLASEDDAAKWLLEEQNPDGSWGDGSKGVDFQVYVTANALEAVEDYLFKQTEHLSNEQEEAYKSAIERGLQWLRIQDVGATTALSKTLLVTRDQALAEELLNYQNFDGGWGKANAFESTPWYTSSAIIALRAFQYNETKEAGKYLLATQEVDGSWENTAVTTSNCILALSLLYSVAPNDDYILAIRKGESWLLNKQEKTGEWFDVFSTANSIVSLKAVYALLRERPELISYQRAVSWLYTKQRKDGSWSAYSSLDIGDLLSTAGVLSALNKEISLHAIEPRIEVEVHLSREHLMAEDKVEVSVKTSNVGVIRVRDLEVVINIPEELGGRQINWAISSLESKEERGKSLSITVPRGVSGRYSIFSSGRYSTDNELNETFHLMPVAFQLRVHTMPLQLLLSPMEVVNGSLESFNLTLKNTDEDEFTIRNLSIELEGWRNASFRIREVVVSPNGVTTQGFEAVAPEKPGRYKVNFTGMLLHPKLGDRAFSHEAEISVVLVLENFFKAVPKVPSRIYNFITLALLGVSALLLLNLLTGFDILE
ncbi:MAG: prenyltransferase/squalene oxidase repeat-containing protein [Candidatus Hydrothermarchaeales archaeon]